MGANFTLKNIPDDVFEKVKRRADRNHRSINGEIIAILDEATAPRRFDSAEFLARARELRARTRGALIDQDFVDAAKRDGRP